MHRAVCFVDRPSQDLRLLDRETRQEEEERHEGGQCHLGQDEDAQAHRHVEHPVAPLLIEDGGEATLLIEDGGEAI